MLNIYVQCGLGIALGASAPTPRCLAKGRGSACLWPLAKRFPQRYHTMMAAHIAIGKGAPRIQ